ncbi:MAG: hypothetical protein AAFN81_02620 [Bacteroidota bacterium]
MAKPSAFRILSVLTNLERKKLLTFLQTKFFSNRKELAPLQRAWQRMQGKPMDEQKLFAAAHPTKQFNKRDWYLLLSRLQDATEAFLGIQYYRTDKMQQQLNTLRALRRLKLPVFFERSLRQARKIRAKQHRAEANMLLWDYQTELAYYDFIASPKRGERTNLQAVTDKLDQFFIAEKLRQVCLAHSRYLANQEEYEIHYLDAILEDLENRPALFKVPAITVYASCYQAVVVGGTEQDFLRLRKVMEHYRDAFPRNEIRDIYLLAINYCIREMNAGKPTFMLETQALYQESLAGGYLLEDGYLPPSTFTNIVALGLKLANYKGVESFIDTYSNELPGPARESVMNFNRARLFHAQEYYDQALKALVLVDTKEPYLYLGAKSLQLRIFIELEEWDAVESLLEQLRVYLLRRDDLGYRGENYRLLLYFCRRLQQLKPGDRSAKNDLRAELEASANFAEKTWLLNQLK